jgi:hypothetical protein
METIAACGLSQPRVHDHSLRSQQSCIGTTGRRYTFLFDSFGGEDRSVYMRSQTKILVIAFPCVTGASYITCNCRPGLMDFMIRNLLQALILEFTPRVLGQQHRISLPIDDQLLCSWCHARGCRFVTYCQVSHKAQVMQLNLSYLIKKRR